MRVREARGDSNLSQKTLGTDGSSEVAPKNLDGDFPRVLFLFGEIHNGHSSVPELMLDGVALQEPAADTRNRPRHFSSPCISSK
jgi:hypothetical protein